MFLSNERILMVNATLISAFAKYANGIDGSDEHLPEELLQAPEVVVPANLVASGVFVPPCLPHVQEMHTAIWTGLQK